MTRQTTQVWQRLVGLVRPWPGRVALGVLASLISAGAAAGWAALVGPLLESVLTSSTQEGQTPDNRVGGAFALPLGIVALAVVKAVAAWLNVALMGSVAQRVLARLRASVYGRLLKLPAKWFEARHSGELLSRFTADVAQVEVAVNQSLSSAVKDLAQVLALLVLCAVVDLRLFLLTFFVLPGMAIPVSRFAKSAKRAATTSQASLAAMGELASEQLANAAVVQSYGLEQRALAKLDQEQQRYLKQMKRSLFIRGAFTPTTEFIGMLGVALALGFGAQAIDTEPALASKLVQFMAAALLMYQPMKALSGTFSQVSHAAGAAARLFEVIDAPIESERLAAAQAGAHEARASALVSLRFDQVQVVYPDGRQALRGVSFEVKAGQHVALVGPSGAGKSSVISALLGFVDLSGGDVWWNGTSTRSLSLTSLRDQMAWVPQEPVLLSGSVRENLQLAVPAATDEAMWRALARAHADGFVKSWPRGLDENVGERGSRLSGGQRQRLAIARAFLKEPSLLVLDEPTSALDAESEALVQEGLAELMSGRTTLVIAHREATIRAADVRIELREGRVVS